MPTDWEHSCSSDNLKILKELEKYSQTIESNSIQTKVQTAHKVNIKQKHILDCPILLNSLFFTSP